MTPFAKIILKSLFEKAHRAGQAETAELLRSSLIQCSAFECSEISEMAAAFAQCHFPQRVDQSLMFLPAPITWIEWKPHDADYLCGFMAETTDEEGEIYVRTVWETPDLKRAQAGARSRIKLGCIPEVDPADLPTEGAAFLAAFLTVINQPRGVDVEVVPAHRGFARKVRKVTGMGLGPLKPWHKVRLSGPPEQGLSGPSGATAVAGGRKCYHSVRSHWRRNGSFVPFHWKGDITLGISRKSYAVTA